jgi:hypothetical protein
MFVGEIAHIYRSLYNWNHFFLNIDKLSFHFSRYDVSIENGTFLFKALEDCLSGEVLKVEQETRHAVFVVKEVRWEVNDVQVHIFVDFVYFLEEELVWGHARFIYRIEGEIRSLKYTPTNEFWNTCV